MRFGFALPQIGSIAGPEALVMVAKRAEEGSSWDQAFTTHFLLSVCSRSPPLIHFGRLPCF